LRAIPNTLTRQKVWTFGVVILVLYFHNRAMFSGPCKK
jgi:hypothetical protein